MSCRLCDGKLVFKFNCNVMQKIDVRYFECSDCLSLQTEEPYWLEEAYSLNLSNLDTGAVQRNIQNLTASYVVAKLLGLRNVIDVGGGDGLLCRLLRDHEINCYVTDKYAVPLYAQGYSQPDFDNPDLLLAFEVFEHYINPGKELFELFSTYNPKVMLVTTTLYSGQKEDWWYLAPESGQHIFFYSKQALDIVAEKYGYELLLSGVYIIFVKKGRASALKKRILKRVLRGRVARILAAIISFLPTPGVWKDHEAQKASSEKTSQY